MYGLVSRQQQKQSRTT